jgi:hypothetical protein
MNRQRIQQQLSSVHVQAIMAGVAMFTGQQLSNDPVLDAACLTVFVLGGVFRKLFDLVKSSRNDDAEESR